MQQSHSASQDIPRLLWNPKFHCRVHKNKSLTPTLSQIHPVHTLPPYFPNIHSNIILLIIMYLIHKQKQSSLLKFLSSH